MIPNTFLRITLWLDRGTNRPGPVTGPYWPVTGPVMPLKKVFGIMMYKESERD